MKTATAILVVVSALLFCLPTTTISTSFSDVTLEITGGKSLAFTVMKPDNISINVSYGFTVRKLIRDVGYKEDNNATIPIDIGGATFYRDFYRTFFFVVTAYMQYQEQRVERKGIILFNYVILLTNDSTKVGISKIT